MCGVCDYRSQSWPSIELNERQFGCSVSGDQEGQQSHGKLDAVQQHGGARVGCSAISMLLFNVNNASS